MIRNCLFTFILLPLTLFGYGVDLREPVYEEGVLRTDKGGIITGPNLRIQAIRMAYTRKTGVENVEAEGDLMVECGEYVFAGSRIEYDLISRSGILYEGRTGVEPWFLGGKEIHLLADGSYKIFDGYATTSENIDLDWEIGSEEALLEEKKYLTTKNVYFKFVKLPLFWLPSFKINLDVIFDNPIRYTARVGGSQGPRVGMIYEIFSWKEWKAFLHLDYLIKRGLGGGFETNYRSKDGNHSLDTINYIANDMTLYNAKFTTRYRFEGLYGAIFNDEKTTIDLSWDKLSDKDMASDYEDKGIQLDTAKRTQLHIRHEENNWIMNFLTRVRINNFQTVKEELPTLAGNFRAFEIGRTGIISENNFKASYLELEYNKNTHENDYNSPRYEFANSIYRPFHFLNLNMTPEIGGVSIYYGSSPKHGGERWMNIGYLGGEINSSFYRYFNSHKHVISPYVKYHYYSFPTYNPNKVYIFDIDDGWYHLSLMRVGFDQSLYKKMTNSSISRDLYLDVWTNLFFNTDTVHSVAPIAYAKCVYNATPYLRQGITTGWDFREGILDHYNYLIEWTLSERLAVSTEYRYRSAFSWRKVDHNNFMLDSFVPVKELRDSQLSDRRDTLLLNFYYKFHPYWALLVNSRFGWDRPRQPQYKEYQINLLGTIRSTWHLQFFYRHREDEDRFSINFSVGLRAPSREDYNSFVPRIEF